MISPAILAGGKKGNSHPAIRTDSREIGPVVGVAMDAAQGEVDRLVGSLVLPRDNVFDMVRCLGMLLRIKAVFATIAGPPATNGQA